MNKLKKEEFPQKRGLTVDEIISKYPMTVRILMVQLVEQIERLQKKKPKVTEAWVQEAIDYIGEYPSYHRLEEKLKEAGVEVEEK